MKNKIDKRHYFLGQFYPKPKSKTDVGFSDIDDHEEHELDKLDVAKLQFAYNHHGDISLGKLIHKIKVSSGEHFVVGYIDTSTAVGELMAKQMESGHMRQLSLSHRAQANPNFETYKMEVQKTFLEISLVPLADYEGCKISHSASTVEIQRMVPILAQHLEKEAKAFHKQFLEETFSILNSMSAPAVPPAASTTVIADPAVATPTPTPTEPTLNTNNKRPAVDGLDPVASKKAKNDEALIAKLSTLQNQPPEVQADIIKSLAKAFTERNEKAEMYEELMKSKREKESEALTTLRDAVTKELASQTKDPKELERLANTLTSNLNSVLSGNDTKAIEDQKFFLNTVLAHSVNHGQQAAQTRAEFEKMKSELEQLKAQQQSREFLSNVGLPQFSTQSERFAPVSHSLIPPFSSQSFVPSTQQAPVAEKTPAVSNEQAFLERQRALFWAKD